MTRLTVCSDTPASKATCLIVTVWRRRPLRSEPLLESVVVRPSIMLCSARRRLSAVVRDVSLVLGKRCHGARNPLSDHGEKTAQLLVRQLRGNWVVSTRDDPLSQHNLDPAVLLKQFFVAAEHTSCFAEELDLLGQGLRDRHLGNSAPKVAVLPIGRLIVKNDEIADLQHILPLLIIDLDDVALTDSRHWKHPDQPEHGALDQMNAGRFQRLHKAARQADRDAVADPLPWPHSRLETKEIGFRAWRTLDVAEQALQRRVVFEVRAAINDTIPRPVLQR